MAYPFELGLQPRQKHSVIEHVAVERQHRLPVWEFGIAVDVIRGNLGGSSGASSPAKRG